MAFGIVAAMEVFQEHILTMFERELRSLCTTCKHYAGCSYRQQSNKVIVQCELFAIPDEPPVVERPGSEFENTRKVQGLCDTCLNQRTCAFFNQNGHVWHCEEFA